jgi:hypothetical protein
MRRSKDPSFYLVRAARTPLSAQGRFSGRLDPPLDEVGLAQAMYAAKYLGSTGVGVVYTSPLSRARMTADAIASQAGVPAEVIPDLTDVDAGVWTGFTHEPRAHGSSIGSFGCPAQAISPPANGCPLCRTASSPPSTLFGVVWASDRRSS